MEEPEEQDHYSVLGLTFGATIREIRSAARKLHLRYHPDKGGDAEQFRKVRMAEETLTDEEKRHDYDWRWPLIREKWQTYREAEELRRRHNEEIARLKQEEIDRRTQEIIRKAQEEQRRAAHERLRRWHEEEERKTKVEADRKRAEEEVQRQRADILRRSRFEQEATARTEAVLENRREQLQEQASKRIKQQLIDDQLQQQRDTWSQFCQRPQDISTSSIQAQQPMNPDQVCKHNLWVKRKSRIKCSACNSTKFLECPDCLQARCQICTRQRL